MLPGRFELGIVLLCCPQEVTAQVSPLVTVFQTSLRRYEIWQEYEARFGPLSRMSPDEYHLITGNNMSKKGVLENGDEPRKRVSKKRVKVTKTSMVVDSEADSAIATASGMMETDVLMTQNVTVASVAPGTPAAITPRRTGRKRKSLT